MKNKTDRAKECECPFHTNCEHSRGHCDPKELKSYFDLTKKEETAHSGLIDTPTAQKEQKVVESEVSDWEQEFDKVWNNDSQLNTKRYQRVKAYLAQNCIPKKELAEKLKDEPVSEDMPLPDFVAISGRNIVKKELRDKFNL